MSKLRCCIHLIFFIFRIYTELLSANRKTCNGCHIHSVIIDQRRHKIASYRISCIMFKQKSFDCGWSSKSHISLLCQENIIQSTIYRMKLLLFFQTNRNGHVFRTNNMLHCCSFSLVYNSFSSLYLSIEWEFHRGAEAWIFSICSLKFDEKKK